mmetsp:Transcript_4582/g.8840  ORF Transcript_4582/g.8840 Transcript_4582/m.8840 type:complete len:206 (+) Transcript_4582:223-840(+)
MSSAGNDSQIEICPDGHRCLNGSKCVENPYDKGGYYCDCQEYIFEVRYEGLYCEHKAEVYCTSHGSFTHSFCTNGGVCVDYVGPDQSHMGCKCPGEYEGTYCQFVRGTMPEGWPYTNSNEMSITEKRNTKNIGSIVGSLIFVITMVIIGAAFAYRRYYFTKENYDPMDSRQLQENPSDDAIDVVGTRKTNNNTGRNSSKEGTGIV